MIDVIGIDSIERSAKVLEIKKEILRVSNKTHEGHIPTAYSILDILYVLYHDIMKYDAEHPENEDRDYLIISKGHSAIGIYAILAEFGFLTYDELYTFGSFKSRLGGHPDRNKVTGVEASTGSLGHGFPMAVGMAMGLQMKKSQNKVFCIVGDGEANEGSIWEAFLLAGQQHLTNLVCILDYNHSIERFIKWGDIGKKIEDFGWEVVETDGHDHKQLQETLARPLSDRPLAVIAHTIKGKGSKTMEEEPSAWHHRSPRDDEMEDLIKELR